MIVIKRVPRYTGGVKPKSGVATLLPCTNVEPLLVSESLEQEAKLMLTNPRHVFRGQSRSSNMVQFDMLGVVSC